MKRFITAGTMALFLTEGVGTLPARANDKMMGKTPAERQEHMAKHLEKMTKELNLSTEQQTAIRNAMQTKMDKMENAMNEYDATVRATLNSDQVKKYDAMKAKEK